MTKPTQLEAIAWPEDKIVVIDTETTGLDPEKDEVLSLAITDINGNNLFYELIKPQKRKRWPKATEVHGIKWVDVKDKEDLFNYEDILTPLFSPDNLIVGYNVWFDIEMLRASGATIRATNTFDVMEEYSSVYGKWSEWKQDRLYAKLTTCAKHYGYKFIAHNALEDAKATAFCFKKLKQDEKYIKQIKEQERKRQEKIVEEKRKEEEHRRAVEAANKKANTITNGCVAILGILFGVVLFSFARCAFGI